MELGLFVGLIFTAGEIIFLLVALFVGQSTIKKVVSFNIENRNMTVKEATKFRRVFYIMITLGCIIMLAGCLSSIAFAVDVPYRLFLGIFSYEILEALSWLLLFTSITSPILVFGITLAVLFYIIIKAKSLANKYKLNTGISIDMQKLFGIRVGGANDTEYI